MKYSREAHFVIKDRITSKEAYFVVSHNTKNPPDKYCEIWLSSSPLSFSHLLTLEEQAKPLTGSITDSFGNTFWAKKGRIHRLGGPAIIWRGGRDIAWYLDGVKYELNEYWERKKNTIHAKKIFAYVYGSP